MGYLPQKIPDVGIKRSHPGVWAYLEAGEEERKKYNRSKYNKTARELAASAVDFLILFSRRQPEREVAKVLTSETVAKFVEALLTKSRMKTSSQDKNLEDMIKRECDIAALMMQKAIVKCLGHVGQPYHNMVRNEARALIGTLGHAATGHKISIDSDLYIEK